MSLLSDFMKDYPRNPHEGWSAEGNFYDVALEGRQDRVEEVVAESDLIAFPEEYTSIPGDEVAPGAQNCVAHLGAVAVIAKHPVQVQEVF